MAWAQNGRLIRGYCYIGERNEVPLFVGEPTPAERDADVGTRPQGDGWQGWTEDQWDDWDRTIPDESDVMYIAGCWSVDPETVDDVHRRHPQVDGLPDRNVHFVRGDDATVDLLQSEQPPLQWTVVTADRGLRARVEALGADVMGPRTLLDRLAAP